MIIPSFCNAQKTNASAEYSVSLGLGYGFIYKGYFNLPSRWTGSSPVIDLSLERATARFSHSLHLGYGRSPDISTKVGKKPGDNSYTWLPIDYSFTWYCCRNIFRLSRLDWGFGATGQWMHLKETIDLRTGQETHHLDDFLGVGLNTVLRWRSRRDRWRIRTRFSLTVSLPFWNRWVIRSNLAPRQSGGLTWLRSILTLMIERKLFSRLWLGIQYERDALPWVRTWTSVFTPSEVASGGNYFLSHLTVKVRYRW